MTLLLVLALLAGLLMIPFGLPGLWVMVLATVLYSYSTGSQIGLTTVLVTAALAAIAEYLEFALAGRYTRKYGGSRRAAWWAIMGGIVGAFVGVPVPLIGSMIGAFVGAFLGAWAGEVTCGSQVGVATRVATGALVGRVTAAAAKVAVGLVLLVWVLFALWL